MVSFVAGALLVASGFWSAWRAERSTAAPFVRRRAQAAVLVLVGLAIAAFGTAEAVVAWRTERELDAADFAILYGVGAALILTTCVAFVRSCLSVRLPAPVCARCRYDLRSAASKTCPECGRSLAGRCAIRLRRRRWPWACATALLLVATTGWIRQPALLDYGWFGLVPTRVLVWTWPWLPDRWMGHHGGSHLDDPWLDRPQHPGSFIDRFYGSESLMTERPIADRALRRLERARSPDEIDRCFAILSVARSDPTIDHIRWRQRLPWPVLLAAIDRPDRDPRAEAIARTLAVELAVVFHGGTHELSRADYPHMPSAAALRDLAARRPDHAALVAGLLTLTGEVLDSDELLHVLDFPIAIYGSCGSPFVWARRWTDPGMARLIAEDLLKSLHDPLAPFRSPGPRALVTPTWLLEAGLLDPAHFDEFEPAFLEALETGDDHVRAHAAEALWILLRREALAERLVRVTIGADDPVQDAVPDAPRLPPLAGLFLATVEMFTRVTPSLAHPRTFDTPPDEDILRQWRDWRLCLRSAVEARRAELERLVLTKPDDDPRPDIRARRRAAAWLLEVLKHDEAE